MPDEEEWRVELLNVEDIAGDPYHIPRAKSEIEDTADSIEQLGLINAVEVTPSEEGYTIISGHRRLEACENIDREKIPAKVIDDITELEARLRRVAENSSRQDSNPMDKINTIGEYANYLASSEENEGRGPQKIDGKIADIVGVSRETIRKWKTIYNEATEEQKQELQDGEITQNQLLSLLNDTPHGKSSDGDDDGSDGSSEDGRKSTTEFTKVNNALQRIYQADPDELKDESRDKIAQRIEDDLLPFYHSITSTDRVLKTYTNLIQELALELSEEDREQLINNITGEN